MAGIIHWLGGWLRNPDSLDSMPSVSPSSKPDNSSNWSLSSSNATPENISSTTPSSNPITRVFSTVSWSSSRSHGMISDSSSSSSNATPENISSTTPSSNPITSVYSTVSWSSSRSHDMISDSSMSNSSADPEVKPDFLDSTPSSSLSANPIVETFSPRVSWLTAGNHDDISNPFESSSAPESSSSIIDYSYGNLSSTSQETHNFQVSHPPLMHGFFGGYIAGVSSIIILVMVVALVIYIVRPRRRHGRHNSASRDVKIISALPPGDNEYIEGESVAAKRAANEAENWAEIGAAIAAEMGAVGTKTVEGDEYQEHPSLQHNDYEMIPSNIQPIYINFKGRAKSLENTIF